MASILNLRNAQPADASGDNGDSTKKQIVAGLTSTRTNVPGNRTEDSKWSYTKEIPTVVLYDDLGLDIYDKITQTDDYYLFNSELVILQKHGSAIANRLFASKRLPKSSPSSSTSDREAADSDGVPTLTDSASEESPSTPSSEEAEVDPDLLEVDSGFARIATASYKEKWGDSRVGKNNYGVNGRLGIEEQPQAEAQASVIELGAGSLKKTGVLLRAMQKSLLASGKFEGLNYYALDLEHGQLVSTLAQLEDNVGEAVTTAVGSASATSGNKIVARGICASYDDALPYLKQGKLDAFDAVHDEAKSILFLGSSIGNYGRQPAVDFLKKISEDAMQPGDTLLIGIDGSDDATTIERAYNDSQGVTRDFILNGVSHADRILGNVGLAKERFEYVNRYNQPAGRHEAYLRAKEAFSIAVDGQTITFDENELVRIERSYKYTPREAATMLAAAGLRVVQKWTDDERSGEGYAMYLAEKPAFHFPSTRDALQKGENPFGVPALAEWDRLWAAWDCVTLSMIPRELLHTKPIDLRHICLFYLGHIPGFLDIHLSRYLKEDYTEPSHYPAMFERGIDPNMEDRSKCHAHSVVPEKMEDWPSVDEIVAYRNRVRERLHKTYAERLQDPAKIDKRLARTMAMVYEHEVMHLETLLYMCAQIEPGRLQAAPGFSAPDWKALLAQWARQVASESRMTRKLVADYPSSTISVGHDDFDHLDASSAYSPADTFGWDNESPKRSLAVPPFSISLLPISNSDYLRFFRSQDEKADLLPGSWMKVSTSRSGYGVRVLTEPGVVDLEEVASNWPCMASGKQLEAYAKSVGGRLPTEGELRRFMVDNPVDHVGANIGFANWHPVPARLPTTSRDGFTTGASNGGVWEWTGTDFAAHEGWRAAELYPDYSRDFHDGCHWVMLGGSFATIPRVAGRGTFTNWYQAGYPYVFAGARVAYDA